MKNIGITVGDANGIGIEVILKALSSRCWPNDINFVLIGSETLIRQQSLEMKIPLSQHINFFDVGSVNWKPGKLDVSASQLALAAIKDGVLKSINGDLDALVTAPINKLGFKKIGLDFPGHTELIASLTQTTRFGMMLIGGGLRVILATRHVPLKEVPSLITKEIIEEAVTLTHEGLSWIGSKNRAIGVCGLNPHAGDGGIIGKEEEEIINPMLKELQKKCINVSDAIPSDTIFYKALKGDYDAIVAMYHDQGLAPLKMLGFEKGVNVTLGLPIIRTSPDHGTAFDIAGKGYASPTSMGEAIQLAVDLSFRENPWK